MKNILFVVALLAGHSIVAQNVGIGTAIPKARLHVADSSVVFSASGDLNLPAGNPPIIGAGRRMLWYVDKAAFRAGHVAGNEWDKDSVGNFSAAIGQNTKAVGNWSTALGLGTIARGRFSFAAGLGCNAIGTHSIAVGESCNAVGIGSVAMGAGTHAIGSASASFGSSTFARGVSSFATGSNTEANGNSSFATGFGSIASGITSFASGNSTIASGISSFAGGNLTRATNANTFATGDGAQASGINSFATGQVTTASGENSFACGTSNVASGNNSFASGAATFATGFYSTAMGRRMSTNGQTGAFSLGDSDPNNEGITLTGVTDQMVARFWNGYYFLTSGNNTRSGVFIGHNGNSWLSICDKTQKENFEPLDGEEVLKKMAGIQLSSWNYKQQDPQQYRHYGIMAQDFYNAFGKDKFGTVGNDTSVNPIDMIGIDMAAIQALEKRTQKIEQLQQENAALKSQLNDIAAELKVLRKETALLMQIQQNKSLKTNAVK